MCRDKFGPLEDVGARVAQAEALRFLCCVFLVLLTSPYMLPVRNTGPVCLSVTETESLLIPYPQTHLIRKSQPYITKTAERLMH